MRRALPVLPGLVALVWVAPLACDEEAGPPAPDGIVRRIASGEVLVPGPEAAGRVGDFVLDNGRARFVIQGPGPSTTWGLYGGAVVDAAALGADGAPTSDRFDELFVQCDLRGFRPESAEIVRPGGASEPGVLRFEGRDGGIPFLDVILPRDPLDARMTVDYVLAPGSEALEVRIAARDLGRQGRRELSCGVVLLPGDTYRLFSPGRGFTDQVGGAQPALVGAGPPGSASFALRRAGGPLNVVLAGLPFLPIGRTRGRSRRAPRSASAISSPSRGEATWKAPCAPPGSGPRGARCASASTRRRSPSSTRSGCASPPLGRRSRSPRLEPTPGAR